MPDETPDPKPPAPKAVSTERPKFVGAHPITMHLPDRRVDIELGDVLPDGIESWQVNNEDWK